MSDAQSISYFFLTIALAVLLAVTPMPFELPDWLSNLKPNWIVLGWFFWIVFQHERCSLILAFFVGIVLDVLFDEPLGINSLLLLVLIYLGRLSLRFIEGSIGLRSSLAILLLCFLVTGAKSAFLLVAMDVSITAESLIMPPLATLLWWILFIPLLNSEHSQFRDSAQ